MVKEERVFGLALKKGRIITLEGSSSEVKEAFLPWAEDAFSDVQKPLKRYRVDLSGVEALLADLEAGQLYSVRFDCGRDKPSTAYGAGFFLGAFHRIGKGVRLRAVVARMSGYNDFYRTAYGLLTRGAPLASVKPPEDLDLLVRAIVYPEKAPLMEKLDERRKNLRILEGHLPLSLAKPLANAVCFEIEPKGLRVWDGVALYRDWHGRWLVFDGKAHEVKEEDWPLVRRILRRKKHTPLERARMAMVMVRLGR